MKVWNLRYWDKCIGLTERNTSICTEVIAGSTTFFAMLYIVFVNPLILSKAGLNFEAVFVATCLTAALGSLLTGLLANYPIAAAPGMAMNIYVANLIVNNPNLNWQLGLGMVFGAGILLLICSWFGVRKLIVSSTPQSLCLGIVVGLGLLIGQVALKNLTGDQLNFIALIHLPYWEIGLVVTGLLLLLILTRYKIPGAILLSILGITSLTMLLGLIHFHGIIAQPPSLKPTLLKLNLSQLWHFTTLKIMFSLFLIALFDSAGTIMGILHKTNSDFLINDSKAFNRSFMAEGLATLFGACVGTSNTSPFLESTAGVYEGGRTGLTAVVVSILFLLALFLAPLAKIIPQYAIVPALLFVAYYLVQEIYHFPWCNYVELIPAILVTITIGYSSSIADGIGLGYLSYVIIKLLTGKGKELNLNLIIFAVIFTIYFLISFIFW